MNKHNLVHNYYFKSNNQKQKFCLKCSMPAKFALDEIKLEKDIFLCGVCWSRWLMIRKDHLLMAIDFFTKTVKEKI